MAAGRSHPAPAKTHDQRLRALRQANEIRSSRAALKKELASGRVRIEDVLARPPDWVRTVKVNVLLLALPKIGPARAARVLNQCRIAPSKTVGGVSERQRGELIERFRG